ncbi:contractile injection system tape measure protein [Pseudoalteromonas luteoviolacea]|uniref:Uncharacterized protein n=1 Tax=Pseudoalteromonas luteoviolacea S4054 TaxID=1129367 RepID=A0A0F6ABB9_9GAMM|nr:contractile injection system tape measure protein [Pseudoalteromonas luteoviolacea]AOT08501.1 hypothetical protein S4054249_11875 [Pseudoalteromonas luteoviolacea]AOT13417.1 hypothetical protein S40542_11850 [Pseudoalteromonas luteoviolacea]AOT18330.1 hypothetical protein S4054_11850 [Pseudoalteromonas luteoviolacea]KKE83502.1 hypothetical protein N479_14115 [Pseudoalteromonas luteoviolacea S4054]KZN75939.1 hypothetical protein N481_06210 [Pseudoalteromonas luteoviolacea S4047-1]
MKLALGQIGAELEAPAHLVNSGQHSVAELESLFKNWLYKEINRLEISWPIPVSDMAPVILDDIEIELPDVDLNALKRDPSNYFKTVFSPAFYTAVERQLIKHLSLSQKHNYLLAPWLLSNELQLEKSELRAYVWQKVMKACWHSLQYRPALFLKMLKSAEWPSMRVRFIEAIYQDQEYLVASLAVVSDGFISKRSESFLSKLSKSECIDLWTDIEILQSVYSSDVHARQQSLSLLSKSYQLYVEQSAFTEQVRRSVIAAIKNKDIPLGYLTTWFTVKGASELTHSDSRSLVQMVRKLSSKVGWLQSKHNFVAQYQPSVLSKLLDNYHDAYEPETTSIQASKKETYLLLAQLHGELGSGCRKSIRALEGLLKLIHTQVTIGELPFYSQMFWREFFAKHDVEQCLPAPLLFSLKRLFNTQLSDQYTLSSKQRFVDYALTLSTRERHWIKHEKSSQVKPVYARRLYVVLCHIKNIPWEYIQQFKHLFGSSIQGSTDFMTPVDIPTYQALLHSLECWLSDELIQIKQSLISESDEGSSLTLSPQSIRPSVSDAIEKIAPAQALEASVTTRLALCNVTTLEPSLQVIFDNASTNYFEQVEAAQLRLTLSVLSQPLNDVTKTVLKRQVAGAKLEKLQSLLRKSTEALISPICETKHDIDPIVENALSHIAKGQSSVLSLLAISEQLIEALEQVICQSRLTQKLNVESAGKALSQLDNTLRTERKAERRQSVEAESGIVEKLPDEASLQHRPSQLELARVLLIATQLRRYCEALNHTIKLNQASIQLHDGHELVVHVMTYLQSWQNVLVVHRISPSTPLFSDAVRSAIFKLNKLREDIYQLNPYINTQAQKEHMWWLELLDISVIPDSRLVKNGSKSTKNDSNDRTSEVSLNEVKNQQAPQVRAKDTLIAINDMSEFVEARSFTEVARLLESRKEQLQAAKKGLEALQELPNSADNIAVKRISSAPIEDIENLPLGTHLSVQSKQVTEGEIDDDARLRVNEASLLQQEQHRVKRISTRLLGQVKAHQNKLSRAGIEKLKAHCEQVLTELRHQYQQSVEHLISMDAGVVLVWPFLEILFNKLELLITTEDGQVMFVDLTAQQKAHSLMCRLVGIDAESEETYVINALLGLELDHKFDGEPIALDSVEQDELNTLIGAVIHRWEALKAMPIDAFRSMFLQRSGEVKLTANGVSIVVESKPQDVLLMKLPWGLGIVQLPWLDTDLINIEWDYGF